MYERQHLVKAAAREGKVAMTPRAISLLSRTALLRRLVVQARLAFRLIREPGVPVLTRTLPDWRCFT
jgi:hypothetical protein